MGLNLVLLQDIHNFFCVNKTKTYNTENWNNFKVNVHVFLKTEVWNIQPLPPLRHQMPLLQKINIISKQETLNKRLPRKKYQKDAYISNNHENKN